MLALFGEHFLPPVLVEALRNLSDQTEPLHWDALESFVRDSLGERFDDLEIDPEAIGGIGELGIQPDIFYRNIVCTVSEQERRDVSLKCAIDASNARQVHGGLDIHGADVPLQGHRGK